MIMSLLGRSSFLIRNVSSNISRAPRICNSFCTKIEKMANFEDVKTAKHKHILVIDVREPVELQETGIIPGSINIPLNEVEIALKDLSSDEFKRRYGIEKPNSQVPIIFSCAKGIRSGKAQNIAFNLGFTNVKNYGGGWLDWQKQIQQSS